MSCLLLSMSKCLTCKTENPFLRFSLCNLNILAKHVNPLIINEPHRTNSALHKRNLWHVRTIKDQALHGHIEDHESLCDQTDSFPCRGPITDLHSTKLRSLFSCHFHWVEEHSASAIKWLGPFKGLKRTKLSSLLCHGLTKK